MVKIHARNIYFVTDVDAIYNDWIGGFSPFEMEIIKKFAIEPVLHLFCGSSSFGQVRIDLNPNAKATIFQDVFKWIENASLPAGSFGTILLDPIYSSEARSELWKGWYSTGIDEDKLLKPRISNEKIDEKSLFVFPYDTRKTALLWNFFEKAYPRRIIIKSLSHYTIPRYEVIAGFNIYPGAFKPNRCLTIYQAKNHSLNEFAGDKK